MTVHDRPSPLAPAHLGRAILAPARQAIHRHSDARLVVHIGGEMLEEAFEGQAILRRGDFVFRPAYFAHANVACGGDAKYTRIPVSPCAVQRWIAQHGWVAGRGKVDIDTIYDGDELLSMAQPDPYVRVCSSTTMQRAAHFLAQPETADAQEVAATLNLAPHQLSRRFFREYGMSPSAYRRQACLQRAVRMLLERSAPLAQIALSAGYHDQSHLTTALRNAFGLTPAAFAKTV